MFEYGSCGEGPHRGSLSLERDRLGGIVGGFAGHEELVCKRAEFRFAARDLQSGQLLLQDAAKICKVNCHLYRYIFFREPDK